MQKQKQGVSLVTSALVILFGIGSYFGVVNIYRDMNAGLFPTVLGDDNENGGDGGSGGGHSSEPKKMENKADKNKQESDKHQSEVAREATKQQLERSRETLKNQREIGRDGDRVVLDGSVNNDMRREDRVGGNDDTDVNDGDGSRADESILLNGSGNRIETRDGDRGMRTDANGLFVDRTKTLSHLNGRLDETEKKLLEQQAKGVDVSSALARLATARASVDQVGASMDASNPEQAKILAEQIKKEAHFAERDVHDAKQVAEEAGHVMQRFGQVNEKLAKLNAMGVDTSAFKTQLTSLQSDFKTIRSATPGTVSRDTVKAFEDKVKNLKRLMEQSLFAHGDTDGSELGDDHKEHAMELEDDLNEVADIEDGTSNSVAATARRVASEHKMGTVAVEDSLKAIQSRTGFAKTLFGPDFTAIDKLKTQTVAMNDRATALESAAASVTDPDIRKILTDQVAALRGEVATLQSFATAEDNQSSILGSILRLFR